MATDRACVRKGVGGATGPGRALPVIGAWVNPGVASPPEAPEALRRH
jgi:hypothetical protein